MLQHILIEVQFHSYILEHAPKYHLKLLAIIQHTACLKNEVNEICTIP